MNWEDKMYYMLFITLGFGFICTILIDQNNYWRFASYIPWLASVILIKL